VPIRGERRRTQSALEQPGYGVRSRANVGWLDRVAYNTAEFAPERVEVDLDADPGAEPFERARGVVLAPVEAAVHRRPCPRPPLSLGHAQYGERTHRKRHEGEREAGQQSTGGSDDVRPHHGRVAREAPHEGQQHEQKHGVEGL
jgi:hypothetical protein